MPDILVLDASALCKLVRSERESDSVQTKITAHLLAGGEVWTDPIAAIELVTCARKAVEDGEGTQAQVTQAVQHALAVAHPSQRTSEDGMAGLVKLACETGLTGPDARYVELAMGRTLLTFDSKQAQAAKARGIPLA